MSSNRPRCTPAPRLATSTRRDLDLPGGQSRSHSIGAVFSIHRPNGSRSVGQAFQPDANAVGQAFQPDVRLESLTYSIENSAAAKGCATRLIPCRSVAPSRIGRSPMETTRLTARGRSQVIIIRLSGSPERPRRASSLDRVGSYFRHFRSTRRDSTSARRLCRATGGVPVSSVSLAPVRSCSISDPFRACAAQRRKSSHPPDASSQGRVFRHWRRGMIGQAGAIGPNLAPMLWFMHVPTMRPPVVERPPATANPAIAMCRRHQGPHSADGQRTRASKSIETMARQRASALSTVNLGVGVPASAGPDRLKAVLKLPDRTLTKH